MTRTPAHQAGVAARKASLAHPSVKRSTPRPAGKPAKAAARPQQRAARPQQRAALLTDTPEQKALKAITSRVLEALKNPAAVPSQIILAALKEARAA